MAMRMWRCDRLYIAVHDSEPPSDLEWSRWLSLCSERSTSDMRCLVETHGGGPNPTQRKQLADIVYKPQLRSAVMTASLVVRGIITALAWAGLPMRSFSLGEQEKAGDWLELTAIEREQVREQLPRMRSEIRRPQPLSSTSL